MAAGEARGIVVEGLLERVGLQPARLCGNPAPTGLPRCPSDAPVADVDELSDRDLDPDPQLADSYGQTQGRFVVDVSDGRITSLTFTAVYVGRSGSFRGSDEYSGQLHLPGDYGEQPSGSSGWPTRIPTATVICGCATSPTRTPRAGEPRGKPAPSSFQSRRRCV